MIKRALEPTVRVGAAVGIVHACRKNTFNKLEARLGGPIWPVQQSATNFATELSKRCDENVIWRSAMPVFPRTRSLDRRLCG
jgi:hypothetical protein